MSRYYSYLNTASDIIKNYDGSEPLSNYLKKFFSSNKKYGSKDRKQISHLCYCYFRTGRLFNELSVEDKIITSLFLCSDFSNDLLKNLKPEWDDKVSMGAEEKCLMLNAQCSTQNLFPFADELSEGIDADAFSKSFLVQPDLFLRIRPGNKEKVLKKFKVSGLKFNVIAEDCITLCNNSKIDGIVELDKEVVIQDYSSQRVGELFKNYKLKTTNHKPKIWDCCAASGGKSILAKDILSDIDLTVSDIRESIIFNLKKRFAEAGIKNYHSFIADLSAVNCQLSSVNYDLIIADVPCSGSGTWSRTPEQLYFFNHQTIEQFNHLQRRIISNVVSKIKPGGYLLYITCSVFKKENEKVVEFIQQQFNLQLIQKEILIGYDKKADTMFAVLLQRPSTTAL
ncbi:MAG: Fmu (Sun) domain-containing protein [Sphingobacteriales bacterium]|nr:Fmu (Sun) domain-containing protein [Sphingobacteriales bacterium]